ncbi:uncharacterized protein LOC132308947 [Cornus florida]|uniref:uncharacterized protein LOC132308947 n=1 Tax=Cornus florida TaxID=4283 RepID=UPI00289BDAF5|nr:uncharacterized protein LOC132308947 [Cornus florida]XP_059663233.1 uncharacterized protein LOC132308947 [Cornus florida]
MMTMEFKGITWVGGIYQKFEAMCLEAEEIMYQDTVKYVEDQVQTVGESVKKFYSDVVQDLLPPSSTDPLEVTAADLFLNPYADVGIYKKPKVSIKDDPIKVDKQVTKPKSSIKEDPTKVDKQVTKDSEVSTGWDADRLSSFSRLCDLDQFPPTSSGSSVKEACSIDEYLFGIKRNSKKNYQPSSEVTRSIASVSKDSSRSSLCYKISENHDVACDQIAMISNPTSVEVTHDFGGGKTYNSIAGATSSLTDALIDLPMSDMILSVESSRNQGPIVRSTSSADGTDCLAVESNAANTCTNSGLVSGSYTTKDAQYGESAGGVLFTSHTGKSGDCNRDMVENNAITEPGMETIVQFDKLKLGESCVLVDGGKLCFVSHREDGKRSYKKKIQEAFSSKMRLARKQEYEQLVVQYEDVGTRSCQKTGENWVPTLTMDAETHNLPTTDFCESEWELL